MKPLKAQNYYDLLGVTRQASPEEIRSAYEISRHTFQENSLATYSLFSDQENQEILSLIAKAFETLFNPESRRTYDAQLRQLEGEPPLHAPPAASAPPGPRPGPRGNGAGTPPAYAGASTTPQGSRPQGTGARIRPEAEGTYRPPAPGLGRDPSRPEPSRTAAPSAPPSALSPAAPPSPPRGVPMPLFRGSSMAPAPSPAQPAPAALKPGPVAQSPVSSAARDELLKTVVRFDGAILKRMRQVLGISLEDLAERTKIRRAYLEYIEEENFQFLPAPVYIKGFVTLVATVLGLPPQRVAEDYMQISKSSKR